MMESVNPLENLEISQNLVGTMNLTERKNKRIVNAGSILITLIAVAVFIGELDNEGYSTYWLYLSLAIFIPLTLIHEYCHFFPQWLFSRQRPHLGWASMFPYSSLATNARTTRNQGIICTMAPLLIITPVLILLSMLFNPLWRLILLALASMEVASCFADLFLVGWFIRHDRQLKWGRIGLANALFREN